MNINVKRQREARKRRIKNRLHKTKFGSECPVIATSNIHYEIADRQQAVSAGGIGLVQRMVKMPD